LLSVIAIPILVSGILTTSIIYSQARSELLDRTDNFGEVMAGQLAVAVTDPLIQEDLLSLNVIVNEANASGDFGLVSVYSADNSLLAQAGKSRSELRIFTRDIVFQDATTGYVQLGLEPVAFSSPVNAIITTSLGLHFAILLLIGCFCWFYSDLAYAWLSHRGVKQSGHDPAGSAAPAPVAEYPHTTQTLLILKVRPLRRLEANRPKLVAAMGLYRGEVDLSDGEDIIVIYRSSDQLLQAMLSACLVQSIMEPLRGTVRCGVHIVPADATPDQVERGRKHATHLASISEEKILMSRQVYEQARSLSQVTIDEYHSSLTPDGEVYFLSSLSDTNRNLIDSQARQFN
jgi:hypothetical protein